MSMFRLQQCGTSVINILLVE